MTGLCAFYNFFLYDQEHQVLVLKNEQGEVNSESLQLPKGKADTVVKGITTALDVADTTSVNTRKRNSIVIQFAQKGLKELQFIGCQYHILDILHVVMENELEEKSQLPILNITRNSRLISTMVKKRLLNQQDGKMT
ncbi:Hypothetical predicted protein [Octopus vulgaris]|uniref:Uncharacterized protein n=1 Tax=Octopus vulgaris TaxID=6645 RepID=A0AA36AQT1_OCTVU|nr:Hypothetical predicted protein [Octopus vulgaris]